MVKKLPDVARKNLIALTKYIHAMKPGAKDIQFIDAMGPSPMRWNMVQFTWREEKGVATLGVKHPNDFVLEHPYKPVLFSYNE